jgi:hypothetical protein
MKLYKREIKPMINPGSFYGVKWDLIPVRDFDNWYPEEREEELAKALNINDPYDILVFEERFVEVEAEPITRSECDLIIDCLKPLEEELGMDITLLMNKIKRYKDITPKPNHVILNTLEFICESLDDKAGTWLLYEGDEMMSLVPMYSCSICGNSFSGYYPPDVCDHCGAKMIRED